LKKALKESHKYLIDHSLISEDGEGYPTFNPKDPTMCSNRDLTLVLLKQHDFLVQRLALVQDIAIQNKKEGTKLNNKDSTDELRKQIAVEEETMKAHQ